MRKILVILGLLCVHTSTCQTGLFRSFPKTAFTAQYAGSIGLYSFGVSKLTERDKLEVGVLYGRLPRSFGGVNNSLVLKLTYTPFRADLGRLFRLEPLQTGLFISQNFNSHSSYLWDDKYPKDYYWWPKSTRFHFFLGSQISWLIGKKNLERLAAFFETNTNDLYVYSYWSNPRALRLYDIFFFGAGLKLYLR